MSDNQILVDVVAIRETQKTTRGLFGRGSFGRPVVRRSESIVTPGNATTTMDTTGGTVLPGISGADDSFAYIPTTADFPFFFFGTNYGSGVAQGIYWNTNNVLGFGAGNSTISWNANTGIGVLCGNYDRRCDPNALYFPIQSTGNFRILRFQANFRNIYSSGSGNEGRMEVRLIRNIVSGDQYIEFRIFKGSGGANGGLITTAGYGATNNNWNITNGTTFQNTYGTTFLSTFPADNTSHVLSCDANGQNWVFTNTSYANI